jgi:glycosyltransferase involved in cell wall biosynthesis
MKILFINSLAEEEKGGGAEVVLWEQMLGLSERGHKCILIATSNEAGLRCTTRYGVTIWLVGIKNIYWQYTKDINRSSLSRTIWHSLDSYNFAMQAYIEKVVLEEKPDVACIHNLVGWSAAVWQTIAKLRIPSVQVLHDYYAICPKSTMYDKGKNCDRQCFRCKVFRLPHRTASEYLCAVVGVSRFILDRHVSEGYFSTVPIKSVIHNVRNVRALVNECGKRTRETTGLNMCIGFIGTLVEYKGIELLIRVFSTITKPNVELWIAGNGKSEYVDRLKKLAKDDGRIRFLGRQKPSAFYPFIDIVVVPSLWHENLPTVIIEAMIFGKPIIAAKSGGIPEMVVEECNGLLFDVDDAATLRSAILRLIDDNDFLLKLGVGSVKASIKFTDKEKWIDDYIGIFERSKSVQEKRVGMALE